MSAISDPAAELELRDRALHAADTHVMIIDVVTPGRPIVFASAALARRHGFTVQQMIGMSLEAFRRGGPGSDIIDAAMQAGEAFRTEIHFSKPDGSPFSVQISLNPVRDAKGELTHYISVGADITARVVKERELRATLDTEHQERARLELELQLAQKLEAVGRLASGIAHEINTPIQYVGDSVHFLRSATTDMERLLKCYRGVIERVDGGEALSAIKDELAAVERAADAEFIASEIPKAFERTLDGVDRVARLVRAMKDFAHPHSSEQSPSDLNYAIQSTLIVATNEYKYCAKALTDLADLPPVTCNLNELNQVFLNLIVNAAHAIDAAGHDASTGLIQIATRIHEADCVQISFSDNGCGIPEEDRRKIFDPFFTTKEVGKGTGQGLALCRAIVIDRHGGQIDVQSTVGKGTTFTLTLPIAGRPATAESQEAAEVG